MAKTKTADVSERRLERCLRFLRRKDPENWTGDILDVNEKVTRITVEDERLSDGDREWMGLLADNGFICEMDIESANIFNRLAEATAQGRKLPYKPLPGLASAWRANPVIVKPDEGMRQDIASAYLRRADIPKVGVEAFFSVEPRCMFIDIEAFGIRDARDRCTFDSAFIYPSYDCDSGKRAIITIAVSQDSCRWCWGAILLDGAGTIEQSAQETARMTRIALAKAPKAVSIDPRKPIRYRAFPMAANDLNIVRFTTVALSWILSGGCTLEEERSRGLLKLCASKSKEACGQGRALEREEARAQAQDAQDPAACEEPAPKVAYAIVALADEDACHEGDKGPSGHRQVHTCIPDIGAMAGQLRANEALVEEYAAKCRSLKEALDAQTSRADALQHHLDQAQCSRRASEDEGRAVESRSELFMAFDIPKSALEALDLAQRAFPDKIVVLPSARKSASEFTKGNVREVWGVLRDAASVLHPLIFGGSTHPERDFSARSEYELTLRDAKHIKSNPDTASARSVEYKGKVHDCVAHLKGKNPKKGEAFRVHFLIDRDDEKIVIAHAGEHIPTAMSSRL